MERKKQRAVDLGRRIAEARTKAGWTQEQLAEAPGVNPMSISRWERGVTVLSVLHAVDLARALRLSLRALLDP